MVEQALTTDMARYRLTPGTPAIRSVGPLAFGPAGVLFVADNRSATIFALGLADDDGGHEPAPVEIDNLDTRLAAFLGCSRDDVSIRDMAVRPGTDVVYLSVMRGAGDEAIPVLVRIAGGGLSEVSPEGLPYASAPIEDAPAPDDERVEVRLVAGDREGEEMVMRNGATIRIARDPLRTVTVTDMAYVDGTLLVAGASNEEFSSTLRRVAFPFAGKSASSSLEIFHVSHGKYETASPIRTFVPYGEDGSILASYTCTPIVRFSLADLQPGAHVHGRTVAELGSGNTPIDMVPFVRDGEEFVLVSNVRHPLMKLARRDLEQQAPLDQPREPVGAARVDLPQQGVSLMANVNGSHVLMMQRDDDGNVHLRSHSCAAL